MEDSIIEDGFVFPFEVLTLTEIFKRRKLFKPVEAGQVQDKATSHLENASNTQQLR